MEISLENADGLGREVWIFSLHGTYLVLTMYAKQSRKTKRHGWLGDKWSSTDERRYVSRLDRPTEIPNWVYEEALKHVTIKIAIGWSTDKSVIAEVRCK
mgnify:CR=1 FL=1